MTEGETNLLDSWLRGVLAPPYVPLPPRAHTSAMLLDARYGVVPFAPGSDAHLRALRSWCETPEGPIVRLIVGAAGTGKTRLAAELAAQLRREGWLAGFLAPPGPSPSAVLHRLAARGGSVLVIVDYAETRSDLAELLAAATAISEHGQTVRVLLLARGAGDWWPVLHSRSGVSVAEALAGVEVVFLEGLADPTATYRHAAAALAARQGMPAPSELPALDPSYSWSYLEAHLAALAAVGTPDDPGHPITAAPGPPADVLADVVARERSHWRRRPDIYGLTDISDTILIRTVIALTLLGAADEDEAINTVARVPELRGAAERRLRSLARWAAAEYPPQHDGTWTSGLRPDALGEALSASMLAADPALVEALLTRLSETQARQALTVLSRASQHQPAAVSVLRAALRADFPHLGEAALSVAAAIGAPLDSLLTEALADPELEVEKDLLIRLTQRIPSETLALPDAAAALGVRLVAQLRAAGDTEHLPGALNNLSRRLTAIGRREDALTAIDEAVALHRGLAAAHPASFTPDLAMSLSNLSIALANVGRREDALAAIEEAVAVRRQLAAAHPDAFTADLAGSLNNLSIALANVGRREDALAASEQGVTISRQLAATHPDAFTADLAMSLNNLSIALAKVGRREDALGAVDEAVMLYRQLVAAQPGAFTGDLAMSLNNLSIALAKVGRREDALGAIEEAVTLLWQLAAAHPDAFTPDLASSLNSLSNQLADLGRREDALAASEQAVTIYRQLAATHPDAFIPDLAGSLNSLSNQLADLGRRDDALAASEQAVTIYRQLAAARPDAFTPNLAMSLNNLSNRLAGLGRRVDALGAIEEAVALRRQLAAARPDAFTPNLAMSLNNLSNQLAGLGRREDALGAIEEAVALHRQLAAARPDAFTPNLAMSLTSLSAALADLGRREDALTAIEEAVALHRRLAAARPDAFTPDLARSLNNQSNRLAAVGRREEALAAVTEAVGLYRRLAAARPDAFTPDLARSLVTLGVRLTEAERFTEARHADREALQLYADLTARWPAAFTESAARAARKLLIDLRDLGYDAAAARAEIEALVPADLAGVVEQPAAGDPIGDALEQWEPLIAAATAVARGEADAQTADELDEALDQLGSQQDWAALIPVLRQIIHDATATNVAGLDPIDTAIAAELRRRARGRHD